MTTENKTIKTIMTDARQAQSPAVIAAYETLIKDSRLHAEFNEEVTDLANKLGFSSDPIKRIRTRLRHASADIETGNWTLKKAAGQMTLVFKATTAPATKTLKEKLQALVDECGLDDVIDVLFIIKDEINEE